MKNNVYYRKEFEFQGITIMSYLTKDNRLLIHTDKIDEISKLLNFKISELFKTSNIPEKTKRIYDTALIIKHCKDNFPKCHPFFLDSKQLEFIERVKYFITKVENIKVDGIKYCTAIKKRHHKDVF